MNQVELNPTFSRQYKYNAVFTLEKGFLSDVYFGIIYHILAIMKVAIAQILRNPYALEENMQAHLHACRQAGEQAADLILFPELSLTGYNLLDTKRQAFTLDDHRLSPLQVLADEYNLTIVAGAPVRHTDRLLLASLILSPKQPISCYTKQHLHGEEQKYFETAPDLNPLLVIGGEKIALSICADINYPEHSKAAMQREATIYLSSIYFESYEMDKAHRQLAAHAKANQMKVLMANFTGTADGRSAGGKSGWWNQEGKLMQSLSPTEPELVVADI